MSAPCPRLWLAVMGVLLIGWIAPGMVKASEPTPAPTVFKPIVINEKLQTRLPLEVSFADESGHAVTLAKFFAPQSSPKPVLLTLVFFRCKSLCSPLLNLLTDALKELKSAHDWEPGRQFELLTVSFDDREDAGMATAKKASYLRALDNPGAASGWHWLTGSAASIAALTNAVGFSFHYNTERDDFDHPATLVVLSPEGVVTRYLPGLKYNPATLKLSLIEASNGALSPSLSERLMLLAGTYDSSTGSYVWQTSRMLMLGGVVFVVVSSGLAAAWLWLLRRKCRHDVPTPATSTAVALEPISPAESPPASTFTPTSSSAR